MFTSYIIKVAVINFIVNLFSVTSLIIEEFRVSSRKKVVVAL